jgi:hypothetical protein
MKLNASNYAIEVTVTIWRKTSFEIESRIQNPSQKCKNKNEVERENQEPTATLSLFKSHASMRMPIPVNAES